jgi:transcription elongation GreA/GreB family factor
MTTEERVLKLENAFATLSELVAQEKTRTDVLLQLVRDHDERMNQQLTWINHLGAESANADARIAQLADAQIRTEEAITRLTERVDRLAVTVERLVEGRNGAQ